MKKIIHKYFYPLLFQFLLLLSHSKKMLKKDIQMKCATPMQLHIAVVFARLKKIFKSYGKALMINRKLQPLTQNL